MAPKLLQLDECLVLVELIERYGLENKGVTREDKEMLWEQIHMEFNVRFNFKIQYYIPISQIGVLNAF